MVKPPAYIEQGDIATKPSQLYGWDGAPVRIGANGDAVKTSQVDTTGIAINPATEDTLAMLRLLLDRLDFGLLTDNAKRLKVNVETGVLSTVSTVSSVTSISNTVRQGDLQIQRVNEALLDTAFINGITNNIAI